MFFGKSSKNTFKLPVPYRIGKVLASIVMFFLIVAGMVILRLADTLENASRARDSEVAAIKELQWIAIANVAQDNYDKAGLLADQVKCELEGALTSGPVSDMDIKEELLEQPTGNPVYNIMLDTIRDKYTNGIPTDQNSVFIASHAGIIADYSLYKFGEMQDRTWKSEVAIRGSTAMSKHAVDAIINQSPGPIFWNTKAAPLGTVMAGAPMTLDTIKDSFYRCGPASLYNYTFLHPSYLHKNEDIFGIPDVSPKGLRQANYKIIIVAAYNLGDVIRVKHPELIASYDHEIDLVNARATQTANSQKTMHYIVLIAALGFALATTLLNNHVSYLFDSLKKSDTGESRGDNIRNE